jgi:hypothetical protein
MKNWLIVSILCLAIVLMPSDAKPQEKPPMAGLVFGCVVIIIGAVGIIGIVKLCKKIPALNGDNAPPPTDPAPIFDPTQVLPPWIIHGNIQSGYYNLSSSTVSFPDPYNHQPSSTGVTFTNELRMTIQSSTNLADWHNALSLTIWESSGGGAFVATYRNGTNSGNFYHSSRSGTNTVPVDFSTGKESKEFFRVVQP